LRTLKEKSQELDRPFEEFVRTGDTLSSARVRKLLGVSDKTLERMRKHREINFIRISDGLFRYTPTAVQLFLSQRGTAV
jgi:hypothetical protein